MKRRFLVLIILLPIAFFASIGLGSVELPFRSILGFDQWNTYQQIIFYEYRVPRGIVGLFAGSALALAGLLMQTLFRNALAGPSVLGLSSGASLVVAALVLGFPFLDLTGVPITLGAIMGSLAVMMIILIVASRFRDITSVLIVGLMLSFFTSAMVSFLQSVAGESEIKAFVFWGFGSFANVGSAKLLLFTLPIVTVVLLSVTLIKPLNALLPGELHAKTMGVNIRLLRTQIVLFTGILVGVVTAFCGPIAFLGLASPHLARFLFKTADHRVILPGSLLIGSILALCCDVIARLPGTEYALPLNTVCAFMGAPVVVYLIFRGSKRQIIL
jgi:iron complex transport system permease protein